MKRLAILASGSGSNAENIARYFSGSGFAEVSFIISNNPEAYVIERAKNLGIECAVVTKAEFMEADKVIAMLRERDIDFVVLAGFLLLVPAKLIQAYPGKIVNIHPALLPKHGGKGMYGIHVQEAVLAAGDTEAGCTVHYVSTEVDGGSIIAQATVEVLPDDTPETLSQRVQAEEKKLLPRIIGELSINL